LSNVCSSYQKMTREADAKSGTTDTKTDTKSGATDGKSGWRSKASVCVTVCFQVLRPPHESQKGNQRQQQVSFIVDSRQHCGFHRLSMLFLAAELIRMSRILTTQCCNLRKTWTVTRQLRFFNFWKATCQDSICTASKIYGQYIIQH
jgi:hypothetical protein